VPNRKPRSWQLQDAKNRLSEVVDEAERTGPQLITRRGKEAVVVLSVAHYERLTQSKEPLLDLLKRAPRIPGGLDVERSEDRGRDVDFEP
jgi:prevent-host-death family protein